MGFNLVLRLKLYDFSLKRKRAYLAHIFFPQFEEVILKTSEASELELAHKYKAGHGRNSQAMRMRTAEYPESFPFNASVSTLCPPGQYIYTGTN